MKADVLAKLGRRRGTLAVNDGTPCILDGDEKIYRFSVS